MGDWRSKAHNPERAPTGSSVYRFLRWLIRLWLTLFFRTIRLLGAETMPDSGAAVLVVNHAAGFFEALILVATFEREVWCLLERKLVPGFADRLLARGLRTVLYDAEGEGWRPALEICSEALARRSAIAIFAEPEARSGKPSRSALTAATIALEAESRQSGHSLSVCPVDIFLPVAPSKSTEVLVYVDEPLFADEYVARGGEEPRERALALAIDSARLRNPFRLHQAEFARFLSDLEEILRRDLTQDWASRSNWKQTSEGFELSRSVRESADQLNTLAPGRLVALRESLERHQEAQRALALRQLQIDLGAPWLKSPWHRIAAWFESAAGLPVAAYGLLNHLLVGIILLATGGLATGGLATGRLKKQGARSGKSVWGARGAVALACYVVQTWACAHFVGRAAAGYYAVSLPLSGAYLARYWWLLRHRTRLVILAASLPAQIARLARLRKQLLSGLDAARGIPIETLAAASEQAVSKAAGQ